VIGCVYNIEPFYACSSANENIDSEVSLVFNVGL